MTVTGSSDATVRIAELRLIEVPYYVYVCASPGTSLSSEPAWGTTCGGTTTELGGPAWTCYHDDTVPRNRAGRDFYIHACIGNASTPKFIASSLADISLCLPGIDTRKIGGFHCLCADMSTPPVRTAVAYTLGATVISATGAPDNRWYRCIQAGTASGTPTWNTTIGGTTADGTVIWLTEPVHPLAGYVAGDILPQSVWDLNKYSDSITGNAGQVYIPAPYDFWVDIYPPSGTGAATSSQFGGTISKSRSYYSFLDDGRQVKKRPATAAEFQAFAEGSNEQSVISGAALPTIVTGASTAGTGARRMVSKYGVEMCCGGLGQWTSTRSWRFDGTPDAFACVTISGANKGLPKVQGTYGDVIVVAGGKATDSPAVCGHQSMNESNWPWNTSAGITTRFVSRCIHRK
jgi:hypothetical protein